METTIDKVEIKRYESYSEALEDIMSQSVKHIGWLNSGITIPNGKYTKVYSNWSGSSVLMCDLVKRIAYSVDMGD